MNKHPAIRLFLNRLLVRSSLSDDDQKTILDLRGRLLELPRGVDYVALGAEVTGSCFVISGLSSRFGQTTDGARQITAFYIQGDMPDLHSVVLPRTTFGLQALTPSIILIVPHSELHKAAQAPAIAEAFWRDCTADAAIASEWIVNVGRRDSLSRIAHLMCEMALRNGHNGGPGAFEFPLPVTQHNVADAVGLSNVHVNRIFQQLKQRDLFTHSGGTAHVIDWEALVAAGDFDPAYLHLHRVSGRLSSPPTQ